MPYALRGKDVLATAKSGSGKTATFLLPILNNLSKQDTSAHNLRALIIVPTRELAVQVSKAIEDFGKYLDIKKLAIFGGVSSKDQAKKLSNGVDIVVATTGRLQEHIKNKAIDLASVNMVVIDEIDTILAMGFLEDIEKILPNVGPKRQITMFSATLNQNVKKLAKEFLFNPEVVQVVSERETVDAIDQKVIEVDPDKKSELLSYLIGSKNYSQVLIFVNTKKQADKLVEHFNLDGLKTLCIHGDIRQSSRGLALRKFKSGDIRILVATDIAARGIDIEKLPVVVNYEMPFSIDDYVHRIGRTGRAGNKGIAITLLEVSEYKMMRKIEKKLILDLPRETVKDFEPTEKKPRIHKSKPVKLSVKKNTRIKNKTLDSRKKNKTLDSRKKNKILDSRKKPISGKKRKTTKRDQNKNFRRG